MLRRGRLIDFTRERVVKFNPSSPPRRGEKILVDGERHRVTSVKVRWDGYRWQIVALRAKPCP